MSANWLVDQLPRAMAGDPVLRGFVAAAEEVADTVRDRIEGIEHQLDVSVATADMLAFLASWLGLELEPSDTPAYRRALVHEVGQVLRWRGTRRGVEHLLEAATGARVTVGDGGGIYGQRDQVPPPDPVVRIELDHTGNLRERQVLAFCEGELPLGSEVELTVLRPQPQAAKHAGEKELTDAR